MTGSILMSGDLLDILSEPFITLERYIPFKEFVEMGQTKKEG